MTDPRAPIRTRVFVDTSAFFAIYSADDVHHLSAVKVGGSMRGRPFATNFVVAETHALLLRRLGRAVAIRFLNEIADESRVVVRVSEEDEQRAREIIFRHSDKNYSYTDATSFAVMERLRIGTAFTFDRHFAQYGFVVLGLDDE